MSVRLSNNEPSFRLRNEADTVVIWWVRRAYFPFSISTIGHRFLGNVFASCIGAIGITTRLLRSSSRPVCTSTKKGYVVWLSGSGFSYKSNCFIRSPGVCQQIAHSLKGGCSSQWLVCCLHAIFCACFPWPFPPTRAQGWQKGLFLNPLLRQVSYCLYAGLWPFLGLSCQISRALQSLPHAICVYRVRMVAAGHLTRQGKQRQADAVKLRVCLQRYLPWGQHQNHLY